MKTLKLLSLLAAGLFISQVTIAQKTVTETFPVSGNCGMCKSKIEKAAKEAGADEANWDKTKKEITVKYSTASTNTAKIQQKIAESGYDNAGFASTLEAYNKLPGCCKYERAASDEAKMDCCKDGKCTKEGHDGKDCCKKDNASKMDCCKEGKCTKEGHDGKDCCKKDHDESH
ncbi:MAG TPA: heavy-metal-associated domain-containing protein [Chitinophagaceae bacterium]|nr:heavy-metal-associated domain-containing protein [Chitinophagaceae bacterium]